MIRNIACEFEGTFSAWDSENAVCEKAVTYWRAMCEESGWQYDNIKGQQREVDVWLKLLTVCPQLLTVPNPHSSGLERIWRNSFLYTQVDGGWT